MKERKTYITLAETVQEALSDFEGHREINPDMVIDEDTIRRMSATDFSDQVFNIISLDGEIPEDLDGWFAVDVRETSYMALEEEYEASWQEMSKRRIQCGDEVIGCDDDQNFEFFIGKCLSIMCEYDPRFQYLSYRGYFYAYQIQKRNGSVAWFADGQVIKRKAA